MLGIGRFGPLGRDVDGPGRPEMAVGPGPGPASSWDGIAVDRGINRDGGGGASAGAAAVAADGAERDALAILVSVDGLGPATLGRLLDALGGAAATLRVAAGPRAEQLLAQAGRDPERGGGLSAGVAGRVVEAAGAADRILDRIRRAELSVVTLADAAYPARLRQIALPPHALFVKGDPAAMDMLRAVAVVGTRRPTDSGRRLAAQIGAAIAREGACVISGLAIGVDGAAHAAVVAEGGRTVAVLGGGHGSLYPRAHARLADEIARSGGAVVSEFAPDVHPMAGTFPRRNHVISGLAEATVVIEAAERSGALTTAAWALEQGRGCFLVPGPIDAPMSAGCLAFLRECSGEARIVAGIPQLLEDLDLLETEVAPQARRGEARVRVRARPRPPASSAMVAALGAVERQVANGLMRGLATVDQLVGDLGLPVATVLGTLTLLEGRGLVTGAYGRFRPAGVLSGAPSPLSIASAGPPAGPRNPDG